MDNDGDPDLYVTSFGRNRLHLNRGDGTFVDHHGIDDGDGVSRQRDVRESFGEPTEVIEPRKLQVGIRFSF